LRKIKIISQKIFLLVNSKFCLKKMIFLSKSIIDKHFFNFWKIFRHLKIILIFDKKFDFSFPIMLTGLKNGVKTLLVCKYFWDHKLFSELFHIFQTNKIIVDKSISTVEHCHSCYTFDFIIIIFIDAVF